MAHLIDKSALVAEINSRININETCQKISGGHEFYRGAIDEAKEILSFLDTLEVKEVDLREEIDVYFQKNKNGYNGLLICKKEDFSVIAKHFFELGLRSTITEEDCKLIWNIGDEIPNMPEEEFFKELLKRYKTQKGE